MLNRAAAVLMVLFAMNAFADGANKTAVRWNRDMAESSELLKRGEYDRALKIADRTIREMLDRLGTGDAATQAFGIVISHKALALAGLGRKEEALWYWHTVISLYPAFAKSDVSAFGEAGAFLDANRKPRKDDLFPSSSGEKHADVTAPVLQKQVTPRFPAGANYFGIKGKLIVSVVITREGKVTWPVILQALPAPTLSYAALEALRQWRFKPAMKDGRPCDAIFELTVNYVS